jgi:hypothetical protein
MNTFTGISYADIDMRLSARQHHTNLSTLWSRLDGIAKEIPKNLLQSIRIPGNLLLF